MSRSLLDTYGFEHISNYHTATIVTALSLLLSSNLEILYSATERLISDTQLNFITWTEPVHGKTNGRVWVL